MKAISKDILKACIVLASIALIAGILLGVIYPITRLSGDEEIDRVKQPLYNIYSADSYDEVDVPKTYTSVDYCFLAKNNGEADAYIIVSKGSGGYGGDVQMYVVVKDNKIIKLSAGSQKESPGVSDKAFNTSYYNQFYDNDITTVGEFILDQNIDAMSGATKTSTAILNAVNNAVAFYVEEVAA